MITESIALSQSELRKLLGAANPDAALLYLYIQAGNPQEGALNDLQLSPSRVSCAAAVLRQLGLVSDTRPSHIASGELPNYTEKDVLDALGTDNSFKALHEDIQVRLGRALSTEDLKILLRCVNYYGLTPDVMIMLVCHCKERLRQKTGKLQVRLGMKSIESEAHIWAERGIATMEDAAAYIQAQNLRNSRLGRLMKTLQIHGRSLTAAEDAYAQSWLDMGLEEELFSVAYQRTCLNTGGLNWAYMNKILQRWHDQGLRTAEAVRSGDSKGGLPKGASGQLGQAELEAIHRVLREG